MPVVLIIADLSGKPQVALERGLALAHKLGAQAEVVAFCYESLGAMGILDERKQQQARKKIQARRKTEIGGAVKELKQSRQKVTVDVVWEKDIRSWLDQRCQEKPYVVVIKTGSNSGKFTYTSTDWHLLRECPSPVMIVSQKKWRSTKPIVAAVDLSSNSKVKRNLNYQVVEIASSLAELMGCELHILHAIHISPLLTELDLVDEYTHGEELKAAVKPKVDELCQHFGIARKNVRLKRGPVEKVITSEAARLKAQLVVMGTVGRKGVKAKIFGNTAEHVLETLRTDVLALKP